MSDPTAVAYVVDVPIDKAGDFIPIEPKKNDERAPDLPTYATLEEFKAAQAQKQAGNEAPQAQKETDNEALKAEDDVVRFAWSMTIGRTIASAAKAADDALGLSGAPHEVSG